jgi:cell division septation protein DedD
MVIFKYRYAGFILMIAVLVVGCGHNKKKNQQAKHQQQAQAQKRRADSLRRVQQRRDSLRQARQDSAAKANKQEKEQSSISLNKHGSYTVQVAAWRSLWKAQKKVKAWKKRGFDNAYTVKYQGSKPGDVWHRVRLGYTDSRSQAEKVKKQIQQKFHTKSWISGSS